VTEFLYAASVLVSFCRWFLRQTQRRKKTEFCQQGGAKFQNRVGFAHSINDNITHLRRRNSASILTAELQTIFQCLKDILPLPYSHSHSFLICSDSLPSLSAITNTSSAHPLISRIHTLLSTLNSISITITFIWIPSHRGSESNEKIDAATKSAAQLPRIHHIRVLPAKSDLTPSIRYRIIDLWTQWQNKKNKQTRYAETPVLAVGIITPTPPTPRNPSHTPRTMSRTYWLRARTLPKDYSRRRA